MALPEVIDLFSGCGGLALGFQKSGFKITHGIEIVPSAVKTASYNLAWRFGKKSNHICGDITKLDSSIFKSYISKSGCIVIGGPPCQAYSIAGKGKLRSLGEERVNTKDVRGFLYQDFIRFSVELEAKAIVMENVPESTNFGGVNIPESVCEILESRGYNAIWTILNAADYGVPQIRERVFVIALKKSENLNYNLPKPTHRSPKYNRTFNEARFAVFNNYEFFRIPNKKTNGLNKWVTVGEALSDLPILFESSSSKYKLNKLNIELAYNKDISCRYQKIMRNWYGSSPNSLTGHAFRNYSRDFKIFARMKEGDNYLDASNIADKILEQRINAIGRNIDKSSEEYQKLVKEIVPPYDRKKFPNKWKKLDSKVPSHTLVAHLSKDTYSHIHPFEPRGISVREAARLQSFPDDFFFDCSMGEAFRQIGNAVPPLLAKGVADSIKKAFKEK